jgi:hypothetical protein
MNMEAFIEKLAAYGFYLFVFLLPWQTRWIWREAHLNGNVWEYGCGSLYATDILLIFLIFLGIFLRRQNKNTSLRPLWAVIGAFFLICFASVLWSQDKGISWYAIARLAEVIGLFWLVQRINFSWPKLGTAIASAGVVQAILGIYQFFSQHVIANKWLGMAAHQPGQLGDSVIATVEGRYLRAYGAFPHPNVLGGFLVICLLILIGFLFTLYTDRKANLGKILLTVLSLIIVSYGLILTFSRSAWLAFGIAFVCLLAISIWHRHHYRLKLLAEVASWMIILVLMTVALVPDIWVTRLAATTPLEQQSMEQRADYYVQARDLFLDHWYQGVGLGDYTGALYDRDTTRAAWDYQPVHNIYVLAATEVGLFGGLLFMAIAIQFFQLILRQLRKEFSQHNWILVWAIVFIAILLLGLSDHYIWTLPSGMFLYWLALAVWAKRYDQIACGGQS